MLGRRIAAALALLAGVALIVALPVFMFRAWPAVAVAGIGLFSAFWGVARGAVSRGARKALWWVVAGSGAGAVVFAFWWTAPRAGTGLIVVGFATATFVLATRMALAGPHSVGTVEVVDAASSSRAVLLMNPRSGGGKVEKFGLQAAADELGLETVTLGPGDDLQALARGAIAGGAEVLGMAGGDGSQALVASIAAEHDVPFVCIPAGTRNHFALDLGLDRNDPRHALASFQGHERRIDYARVNGRLFVNNVSLGLYARVVQEPGYRDAKTKTAADLLPDLLGDGVEPFDLRFNGPDGRRYEGAQLLLVSNNPYELTEGGDLVGRTRLDSGQLGVAAVALFDAPSVSRFVQVVHRVRLGRHDGLMQWNCLNFRVDSGDASVPAGIDGEALQLEPPLEFSIVPRGLRILVPPGSRAPAARTRTFDPTTLKRLWQVGTGRELDDRNGLVDTGSGPGV